MVPLTVPTEDRRITLRSFWFLISLISGIGITMAGWLVHLPVPWLLGVAAFVAAGWMVFGQERLVRRLYHAWNNRIIVPLSDLASAIVLRVCLLLVFSATGRAGSRLRKSEPGNSAWQVRDALARIDDKAFADRGGWLRNYLGWAVRSNNAWAIFLVPFFSLLRMLSIEETRNSGANDIYTLF